MMAAVATKTPRAEIADMMFMAFWLLWANRYRLAMSNGRRWRLNGGRRYAPFLLESLDDKSRAALVRARDIGTIEDKAEGESQDVIEG